MSNALRHGVTLGCLLASGVATAATIMSPPLRNNPNFSPFLDTFFCSVVSTKTSPIPDVTIDLVRADGTVIVAAGPLTLVPNDERTIIWEAGEIEAYCRVTGRVSKSRTLITLCNATTSNVDAADFRCHAVVTSP